jgi:hypothetical protein
MLLVGLIINKLCTMHFLPNSKKIIFCTISIYYQTVVV